jgi:hypothetical protein
MRLERKRDELTVISKVTIKAEKRSAEKTLYTQNAIDSWKGGV